MTKQTLWPDFDFINDSRTIRRILGDEGAGIEEKTNGIIKFSVETDGTSDGKITHHCYLKLLQIFYQYPFLSVSHDINEYPATIHADIFKKGKLVNNESELIDSLREIFGSTETKKLIRKLYRAVQ